MSNEIFFKIFPNQKYSNHYYSESSRCSPQNIKSCLFLILAWFTMYIFTSLFSVGIPKMSCHGKSWSLACYYQTVIKLTSTREMCVMILLSDVSTMWRWSSGFLRGPSLAAGTCIFLHLLKHENYTSAEYLFWQAL